MTAAPPLNPQALVQRILHGGRGGYCFEANTVLQTLLETLGFADDFGNLTRFNAAFCAAYGTTPSGHRAFRDLSSRTAGG